tara:strand:+ start:1349 stop:1561 length:213 start_codon:yes stop_codon:yes gene_type:complete
MQSLKEAYRLFYMVKGHMRITDKTAFDCADGYFKRLWKDGSNGAPLYEYDERFEKAWAEEVRKGRFDESK